MIGLFIGLAAQASFAAVPAPAPATAPAANARAGINPNANALFERDPQLKAWAIRIYDANHDGWLTLYEAQPALRAFKDIADADRDGRVTTYEYRRAKDFVAARWAVN